MSQDFLLQIPLTAVRIYQATVFIPGDGIDGQVASLEIFFKSNTGMKIHIEPMVSMAGLFLGSGQRIFLTVFGVQKYREGGADLLEALIQHFLRCTSDYNPIPFCCFQPQKRIANRTTNQVGFWGVQRRGCRRKACRRRCRAEPVR